MTIIGILGHGEIGSSLHRVYDMVKLYDIIIRDPYIKMNDTLETCDIINICIPFFGYEKFITTLEELNLKKGSIIIIHSTIGVGSTDKIQNHLSENIVIHSPCRGVHPNLTESMLVFDKYMGISEKYYNNKNIVENIENHLKLLNMNPVICKAKESELAKVVSTTLYGINIAAINDVSEMCEKLNVNFDVVFTKWQKNYNEGYVKMGKPNVQRPILTPIPKNEDGDKIIGGHCVLPNAVILKKMGEKNLSNFVLRYSDNTSRTHQTGAKH
jgi:hypothetical protein